jgi:predicted transcriptional regulator
MNNSKNIIEGIGIIENNCARENKKYYKIYTDNNYNRYIYRSNFRINRIHFNNYEKEVISCLEECLFKSAYHCKRGQGIQKLPKRIINNEEFNFVKFLINMYNSRFVTIKNIKIVQ